MRKQDQARAIMGTHLIHATGLHELLEDTVIEAIVCPPEIRGKLPGDYGRDKGVAWYALEGFSLVHTVAAQARIVKWASNGF